MNKVLSTCANVTADIAKTCKTTVMEAVGHACG